MKGLFFLFFALLPVVSGCGRVAERAIGSVGRVAEQRSAVILARDFDRDAASKLTRLPQSRRVFKYTTNADARRMMAKGIPTGSHFTTGVKPGRPLSSSSAAKRFGLGYKPGKRLSVTLPGGTGVKVNKVVGGSPGGFGEIAVEQPLRPSSVTKSIALSRH
jgi:uncharacterized protein YceK